MVIRANSKCAHQVRPPVVGWRADRGSTLRDFSGVAFASSGYHRGAPDASGWEWLRDAAEDLAVEDSVPGIGVRRPAAPPFGDLA
jgi:hypothetical protein